jgi:hypothetical protein
MVSEGGLLGEVSRGSMRTSGTFGRGAVTTGPLSSVRTVVGFEGGMTINGVDPSASSIVLPQVNSKKLLKSGSV